MSKYRKVDTKLWNDAWFRSLSERGQLAWLFLMTHPNMTMVGAMRATVPGLVAEILHGREGLVEAYTEAFREVFGKGKAKHDGKAAFVWLPNFLKYNRPESPNVVKAWPEAFDLLPECPLKAELFQHLKAYTQGLTEGFSKAFQQAFREDYLEDYAESGAGTGAGTGAGKERARVFPSIPEDSLEGVVRDKEYIYIKATTQARASIGNHFENDDAERFLENLPARVSLANDDAPTGDFLISATCEPSAATRPTPQPHEQSGSPAENEAAAHDLRPAGRVDESFMSDSVPSREKTEPGNRAETPQERLGGTVGPAEAHKPQGDPVERESATVREVTGPGKGGSECDEPADVLVARILGAYPRHARGSFLEVTIVGKAEQIAERDKCSLANALRYILDRTNAYAQRVASWPENERRFAAAAQKFFETEIYEQDPAFWGGGGESNGNREAAREARIREVVGAVAPGGRLEGGAGSADIRAAFGLDRNAVQSVRADYRRTALVGPGNRVRPR